MPATLVTPEFDRAVCQGVRPTRIARIAACTLSRLPVLASTLLTWVLTVLMVKYRRTEISLLFNPAPIRRARRFPEW